MKYPKIYKYLISTHYMIKKDLKETQKGFKDKPRAETVTVKGTLTQNQREVVQKLIGILGSNEQDVVGKILTLWLYNEGFLNTKKQNDSKTKNKNEVSQQ